MALNISLIGAGKKYYREWIFRNVSIDFSAGQKIVIQGPNGSGKSTLLQVIAGAIMPNEGSISYMNGSDEIDSENFYNHITFAAPYLELIEEFTLNEIISFHFKFKKVIHNFSEDDILNLTGLQLKSDKIFKYFSSGMKQRVKLTLAILSESSIILLDEPCSNLDNSGIEWYREMISKYSANRIVIVASNQNKMEYDFCEFSYDMSDLKN